MKKAAIVTLYGNTNFGNKLQNYAVQEILKSYGYDTETLRTYNSIYSNNAYLKNRIRYFVKRITPNKLYRNKNFKVFEKEYLKNSQKVYYSNEKEYLKEKYDIYAVGSDQVWNPYFGLKQNLTFLPGICNKFSVSASFGIDEIEEKFLSFYKEGLNSFKYISVREFKGKEIIKRINDRDDIEVLIDPTMMINASDWEKIMKKPKQLKTDKFILNYFLGEISKNREDEIKRVAKENDCEIINVLDKKSEYYKCGPSEFLYLEKNAFLVCTDSFHSCVFAFLFNKPFVIFDREQNNYKSMNSRLKTLIDKFQIKNREFNGKITIENLQNDYSEGYKLLAVEREKYNNYIERAINGR